MRRSLLIAAVVAVLTVPSATAAPVFVVVGRGWGHGIGMSQYGAYGYALHGRGYEWILDHYYAGTTPGTSSRMIDVVLATGRSSIVVGSATAWQVRGAGSTRWWNLPAGASRTVGTGLTVRAEGKPRTLASPITFRASGGVMQLFGKPYRGRMVVKKPGGSLSAVNHVGLEKYLYGVVPSEMPASWHRTALKAQAVAARTFASRFQSVSATTSSQVYGGVWAEHASSTAAVEATRGEIRRYGGAVAQTYFFSGSGGRTGANEDVWGGTPIPYLRSVRDRYDRLGGNNPNFRWNLLPMSRTVFADRLGSHVQGKLRDVTVAVNPSGRAQTVTVKGSGGTSTISGLDVSGGMRSLLGLKSTWFRIGVLRLSVGRTNVEPGARVMVRGLARGAAAARLERKRGSDPWETILELQLGSDGSFAVPRRPQGTTSFRVRVQRFYGTTLGAAARSGVATIMVKARPALFAPVDRSGLSGIVSPAEGGVAVAVQRRSPDGWTTVGRTVTDPVGRFRIPFALSDGTYRAATMRGRAVVHATSELRIVGQS